MATRTHPHEWWSTDPRLLATVLDVLDENKRIESRG